MKVYNVFTKDELYAMLDGKQVIMKNTDGSDIICVSEEGLRNIMFFLDEEE